MRRFVPVFVLGLFLPGVGSLAYGQDPAPWISATTSSSLIPAASSSASERSAEPQLKFSAEWILWWLRKGYVPPMLTTGTTESQGVLGQPGTRVLYGDERIKTRHEDRFNGIRFGLEWDLIEGQLGIEGRGFFLERDSTYFKAYSNGSQLLALSYIDARTSQQASMVVAGQDPQRGLLSGGFVGYSRIEMFGEEANLIFPLFRSDDYRLDLLAGARFLQMRDRYHHTATSRGGPDQSVLYGLTDNYRIANAFYGAQLGARAEAWFDRFFIQGRATVALGGDAQRIQTFSLTTFQNPQRKVTYPTGLTVLPGNTGDFRRGHVDGVAEVGANVGYQFTRWLRGSVGYTCMTWFDPLRAGDQVDRVVDLSQNSPGKPGVPFKGDVLWAQGINAGLEVRW